VFGELLGACTGKISGRNLAFTKARSSPPSKVTVARIQPNTQLFLY